MSTQLLSNMRECPHHHLENILLELGRATVHLYFICLHEVSSNWKYIPPSIIPLKEWGTDRLPSRLKTRIASMMS